MATVSYSDYYESRQKKSTAQKRDFKVGYFNALKNDGDEAIVRFTYEDVKEFNLQTVHRVKVGEFYRSVACLKEHFYDDNSTCPLCAKGETKAATKVYVKFLEYTKDENGKVIATAKVWERPAKFTQKIVSAYNMALDMGIYPASSKINDVVFKIKRNGVAGSKDTDYDVTPTNPVVYKPELYVKDFSDFEGLDLAHHSYWVRTAEEINEFLTTGSFPVREYKKTESDAVEVKSTTAEETVTEAKEEHPTESQPSAPRRYRF